MAYMARLAPDTNELSQLAKDVARQLTLGQKALLQSDDSTNSLTNGDNSLFNRIVQKAKQAITSSRRTVRGLRNAENITAQEGRADDDVSKMIAYVMTGTLSEQEGAQDTQTKIQLLVKVVMGSNFVYERPEINESASVNRPASNTQQLERPTLTQTEPLSESEQSIPSVRSTDSADENAEIQESAPELTEQETMSIPKILELFSRFEEGQKEIEQLGRRVEKVESDLSQSKQPSDKVKNARKVENELFEGDRQLTISYQHATLNPEKWMFISMHVSEVTQKLESALEELAVTKERLELVERAREPVLKPSKISSSKFTLN